MPTKLGRNYLNLCFTKIKNPLSTAQSSPPITHTADRRRQTTRSFSSTAAAFITNYNSLYEITTTTTTNSDSNSPSTPLFGLTNDIGVADPDAYVAVDFITAFTSHRFFFSSPGSSNSIIESTTTTTTESTTTMSLSSEYSARYEGNDDDLMIFNNSHVIPTYSPDPYMDFRRSMQEMMEAREKMTTAVATTTTMKKSSWEFLHELLLCYLALNPKTTHKHILKAFADIATVIKPPLAMKETEEEENVDREKGGSEEEEEEEEEEVGPT
ncbi:transcription repressor OFP12 [Cucumis sativus]|uniref:transcription repressor OFP12 n=1 Tax=Cucumis sativus TaxID=3659 RepID=UPI0012F479C6|nr:transcription repressor OFP12 [Cucumis sativus]